MKPDFGSWFQKHNSPPKQGVRSASGRHSNRRRSHMFNHTHKVERANWKQGE